MEKCVSVYTEKGREKMRNPNRNMLLAIAMGDAYAAATEYIKHPRDDDTRELALLLVGYVGHPSHDMKLAAYTDDAEMSVANARVLTQETSPYTSHMFADAYVAEFQYGGRRNGYSRRFQKLLESVRSGKELLASINPISNKNGAAMRSVPIGVLSSVHDVLEVATLQARITHDTPEGRFSARAVALMSRFALYEEGEFGAPLASYLCEHLPKEDVTKFGRIFRERWDGGPVCGRADTSVAITTVHAVFDLLAHQPSMLDILMQTIRWGGDTDSVAAIAWGIKSARENIDHLPEFFARELEGGNPRTGQERLRNLGENLMSRFA